MADIFPLKGYRYNAKKIENLGEVVSPPYDKIGNDEKQKYLSKNPYNIVNIILGHGEHTAKEHQTAAEKLENWIQNQILIQDLEAGFYVYEQEYEIGGIKKKRIGFAGLGKIGEGETSIKAHEETMEGPKADRLNLLRAAEANLGHIFMMYSDEKKIVRQLLVETSSQELPLIDIKDEQGNIHKLWSITDEKKIDLIQEQMQKKDLYIADGHHRYQTALNFKQECEKKGYQGDFDRRLMTFFNFEDPGLTILATHRLLYGIEDFKTEDFLKGLSENFTIQTYSRPEEMFNELDNADQENNVFGFYSKDSEKYRVISLAENSRKVIMDQINHGHSESWKSLDVAVLHKAILEKHLGFDKKALAQKQNIDYVRGRENTLKRLDDSCYQACFILRPTPVSMVKKVADCGERMPQKSTDFYPKLLTGLVLHKLNIKK